MISAIFGFLALLVILFLFVSVKIVRQGYHYTIEYFGRFTTVARPGTLREKALAGQAGGLSGKPLFAPSTRLLAETFLRVERKLPLIGVGGVDSAEAAWAKIRAGASLVQLYSAMVYKGPGLVGEIKRGLLDRLGREKVSLDQAIGRDASDLAQGRF